MAGVSIRSRSLIGLPFGSSNMALMPEPPMSMASVMGDAAEAERFGGLELALGVIRKNCKGKERGTGNEGARERERSAL